mmetsp:Transcript_14456/g.20184  ORF Transcript_14456/g.20184 Transcript_14456/m.20184 type:complete len:523 (+) Transcript_14456:192-1760(+)
MLSFIFGDDEEEIRHQQMLEAQAQAKAKLEAEAKAKAKAASPSSKMEFPEWTHGILVTGFASGKAKLNGEYKMVGKWVEGRPVYASVDEGSPMRIWFSDGWCLGPKAHMGTSIAMAHNDYKGARIWLTDKAWRVQVGGEIKDEFNVKVVPLMAAIVVGADGSNTALNGCYELQTDLIKLPKSVRDKFQNRPVYKKKGGEGGPHCLWCCDQGWCIGLESDVGTKTCYAASEDVDAVPWLVRTPWKMVRNSGGVGPEANGGIPYWSESSNLQVVPAAEAELSGCQVSGGAWNGVYILREDWAALPFFSRRAFRGRPVFRHKTGKQQCIWFSELGWCVGLEKDLGTTRCGIYNKSDAAVPWLCTQPWQVLEKGQFSACLSLRIAPVYTEDSKKGRLARLSAAAKAGEKNERQQPEMASKGGAVTSGTGGKGRSEAQRLTSIVQDLENRATELDTEGKGICDRFTEVSLSVGLTEQMAKDKLNEAESVAGKSGMEREQGMEKLPPLLKTLVSKLDELRKNMEELVI